MNKTAILSAILLAGAGCMSARHPKVSISPLLQETDVFRGYDHPIVASDLLEGEYSDWPFASAGLPKRMNIDLWLDGQVARRIGWGVPTRTNAIETSYSPRPGDYTILSESAEVVFSDLEGLEYCRSMPFVVAGIDVLTPIDGQEIATGEPIQVSWRSSGAGDAQELGYIVPDGTYTALAIYTNCLPVPATNSRTYSVTILGPLPEVRFVLRSLSDQAVVGYSKTVSIN